MNSAIASLVGRRISGIVVTQRWEPVPRNELYLYFDDGTSYELFGHFDGSSSLRPGTLSPDMVAGSPASIEAVYRLD